jgi:hypothetical protein
MTKYFVRNLKPLTLTDAYCANAMTHILRHMFWWADWTEISLDADAAWANTIAVSDPTGSPGFRVYAAQPRIIEDLDGAGRFTASMATNEHLIFLKGTGQNRVVARIERYIDAHHVEITANSAPPLGWADEGGVVPIPGKIIGGDSAGTMTFNSAACRLAAAKGVLMQAPSGNLQVRLYHQTTAIFTAYARPKGGSGTATEVGAGTTLVGNTDNIMRIHAVFEGRNGLIYMTADQTTSQSFFLLFGELDDVDTGDTDPGFIMMDRDSTTTYPVVYSMNMLNGNPTPASIAAYPLFIKRQVGTDYASGNWNLQGWRLSGSRPGKAALRKVRVALDNIVNYGACVRGKLPLIRHTHTDFEWWRPLDAAGAWQHLFYGLVVPRNGPGDQLIIL